MCIFARSNSLTVVISIQFGIKSVRKRSSLWMICMKGLSGQNSVGPVLDLNWDIFQYQLCKHSNSHFSYQDYWLRNINFTFIKCISTSWNWVWLHEIDSNFMTLISTSRNWFWPHEIDFNFMNHDIDFDFTKLITSPPEGERDSFVCPRWSVFDR